jgi:hypothetical protein
MMQTMNVALTLAIGVTIGKTLILLAATSPDPFVAPAKAFAGALAGSLSQVAGQVASGQYISF